VVTRPRNPQLGIPDTAVYTAVDLVETLLYHNLKLEKKGRFCGHQTQKSTAVDLVETILYHKLKTWKRGQNYGTKGFRPYLQLCPGYLGVVHLYTAVSGIPRCCIGVLNLVPCTLDLLVDLLVDLDRRGYTAMLHAQVMVPGGTCTRSSTPWYGRLI
jgi:hypothetical protein